MTPAEHLAEADRQLSVLASTDYPELIAESLVPAVTALAHTVAAIAAELGVPHGGTGGGGDSARAQSAAG